MKLVAPGNSRLSFMRMLDAQTTECGRTGKVCSDTFYKSFMEWVISSYEVNKLCSEQPFICPACCPQMLAVSVDGNRKHYRFKKDGCTDEAGYFEGVLLCKDDEVAAFVEDIQRRTKHVPGKGVCGRSQLNAAKETSKRSSSSLDEQGIEVAVCRHGIILRALNMFRGEIFAYPMFLQKEVSAISPPTFFCMDVICKYWPYISRICEAYPEYHHLTTMKPFLSVLHAKAHDKMGRRKSGWSWFHLGRGGGNGQLLPLQDCHKHQVYGKRRFHKTQRDLQRERQSLEAIKEDLSLNDETVRQWVTDVQDWAEHDSPAGSSDSLLEVRRRIEENSLGLRQRRARLYSHTDTNSGRSVIRSRMWRERNQLEVHVAQHDEMVQPQQQIGAVENLLNAGYIFPWLLPPSDGIDFLAKKKVFDNVMHVKRLEEEVKILATEVRQHWEYLKKREHDLSGLFTSIEGSHRSLSKEGLQGLQGELKCKLFQQRSQLALVRQKYLELIKAGLQGSMLDLVWGEEPEESEEQALRSANESSSDEEDIDMQGLDSGQQIPEEDVVDP
ncbi:unnamed protein product [Pleuronectes platessa]|uniref:Uncharacterized protein n=1 Tax=Pleuronectes platessa TaxID=8262 RepID=A0A9N7W044_PLEPL|nr:unnamed protein product [Pleuronectes platessa]